LHSGAAYVNTSGDTSYEGRCLLLSEVTKECPLGLLVLQLVHLALCAIGRLTSLLGFIACD
jgi:hypothetical protein